MTEPSPEETWAMELLVKDVESPVFTVFSELREPCRRTLRKSEKHM